MARLAATGANLSSIDAIITMSTPHSQPPVAMEAAMQTVYNKINTPIAHKSDEKRPLLISICGGQSDGQIVSDACALPDSVITPDDGFAVFTTSIPGVWTGVEHQAMVWCHQVRWRVARALLDMSRQPSRGAKLEVATKWLLGPTHLNTLPSNAHDLETYKLDTDGLNKAIIVHFPGTTEDTIAEPPLSVRYCRADGFCEAAQPEVHVIPWLSDNGRPFPSAGEGSHPEEAAFVIDLNSAFVPAAWVELTAPRGATIITGLHGSVSPRGAWGESYNLL